MILIVVVELIVDVDWFLHESGYVEGEGAVELIGIAEIVIVDWDLYDAAGEYNHGYTCSEEDGGHDEEEGDGFGECWYG